MLEYYDKLKTNGLSIESNLNNYITQCFEQAIKDKNNLNEIIMQCERQINGEWDPHTLEIINKNKLSPAYHNFTELKIRVLNAIVKDFIYEVIDMPFSYKLTPKPTFTKELRKIFADKFKTTLLMASVSNPDIISTPEGLIDVIEAIKKDIEKEEHVILTYNLSKITEQIKDWLAESNFKNYFLNIINQWSKYPFVVLEGGYFVNKNKFKFFNNKTIVKKEKALYFNIPDIKDVFIPDENGKSIQDLSYVIILKIWSINDLQLMKEDKSYIKSNVKILLDIIKSYDTYNVSDGNNGKNILSHNISNSLWDSYDSNYDSNNNQLRGLVFYGKILGLYLKPHLEYIDGLDEVEDYIEYEVEITIIGECIVKIHYNEISATLGRPVYSASYQDNINILKGQSIPQLIKESLYMYHGILRSYVLNNSQSATSTWSVNETYIKHYMENNKQIMLTPGNVSVLSGMDERAVFQQYINPNYTSQYSSQLEYWKAQMDYETGISSSLHGFTDAMSGASKTYRGQVANYSNLIKPIQSALYNIDSNILEPLGLRLYYTLLFSPEGQYIKADESIEVIGTRGLVEKEVRAKEKMDKINTLIPLAQMTGDNSMIQDLINGYIEDIGIISQGTPNIGKVPTTSGQGETPANDILKGDLQKHEDYTKRINNDNYVR